MVVGPFADCDLVSLVVRNCLFNSKRHDEQRIAMKDANAPSFIAAVFPSTKSGRYNRPNAYDIP